MLQHLPDLFLGGISVAGHHLFDAPWRIFCHGNVVHHGGGDHYALGTPQFQHTLHVLTEEGGFDGQLRGAMLSQDARHQSIYRPQPVVHVGFAVQGDGIHLQHDGDITGHLQKGITHNDTAWINAQDNFGRFSQGGVTFEEKSIFLGKIIEIFIRRWAGPLLFCVLAWSVFIQLRSQPDLRGQLDRMLEGLEGENAIYFGAAVVLMVLNWALEAMKWQILMRGLTTMRFMQAYRAILAGVAFSLNTPNRIGEMGGRMLFVPEGLRLRSVPLTITGGFAQLLVTLMAGLAGWYFIGDDLLQSAIPATLIPVFRLLPWAVLLFAVPSLYLYLRQERAWALMGRLPLLQKWQRFAEGLRAVDPRRAWMVLGLSFLRFLVFALQYVFMLWSMNAGGDLLISLSSVSVFYLLMAVVPSIALLELGLRWQYGIIVFGAFNPNLVGIYTASTAIWLVNLLIPAMIGTFMAASFGRSGIKKA